MNASLAIIAREIRHQRLVFLGGLLTAATILLVAALSVGRWTFADAAEACGLVALPASLLLGVVLGAIVAGADLDRARAVFWLARPVPAWMVYAAKVVGSWLIAIGATALVALPAIVVTPAVVVSARNLGLVSAFACIGIAVGAAFSVLLRARSWSVFAALGALAALGWAIAKVVEIAFENPFGPVRVWFEMTVLILVIALVLGRGVAFTRGRYDLRLQARVVATAIAIGVTAILATTATAIAWVRSLDLRDMTDFYVADVSRDGSRVIVSGQQASGFGVIVVLDLTTGRTTSLTGAAMFAEGVAASEVSFWLQPVSQDRRQQRLMRIDSSGRQKATGFEFHQPQAIAASPSNGIVAVASRERTDVVALDRGRIATVPAAFEDAITSVPVFESDRVLRLYELAADRKRWRVRRVDLTDGTVTETGVLESRVFVLTPDLSRAIARKSHEPLRVVDATTGERLLEFPAGTHWAVPLAGGEYAAIWRDPVTTVALVSRDGAIVRSVPVPDVSQASLIGEIRPRTVVVGSYGRQSRAVAVVDLSTGEILRRFAGARPLAWGRFNNVAFAPQSPTIGTLTTDHGLFRIDPKTLELIPLIETD